MTSATKSSRALITVLAASFLATGCGDSEPKKTEGDKPKKTATSTTSTTETATTATQPTTETQAEPAPGAFTAQVKGGQTVGGPQVWKASKGDEVSITVQSDIADELHLHGYDISEDVSAGGSATLKLAADASGSFELELEHSKVIVGNLEVR